VIITSTMFYVILVHHHINDVYIITLTMIVLSSHQRCLHHHINDDRLHHHINDDRLHHHINDDRLHHHINDDRLHHHINDERFITSSPHQRCLPQQEIVIGYFFAS
jgi:hypothetical protein